MAYDDFIGKTYAPFSAEIEKGRLRMFAEAIGDSNPIYRDEAAAREVGYASIPAPPTFPFALAMDAGQSFNILNDMNLPVMRAVHGGQSFTYHRPMCAGNVITGQQTIERVIEKRGGALLFIIANIEMRNQRGEAVCDLGTTVVVRRD